MWTSVDADVDAALLEITDSHWVPPSDPAHLRWGEFTGGLAWTAATILAAHQVRVEVNPLNRRLPHRWDLRMSGEAPSSDAAGAAVFTGSLLAGIAVGDPAGCVPVAAAVRSPDFLACIETALRQPLYLEPVELEGVIHQWSVSIDSGTPAHLFDPVRAVAPFYGRKQELRRLMEWCRSPARLAGRLMSGPAGVGKSRLARELGRVLVDEGWLVVELSVTRLPADALRHLELVDRPLLIIVDGLDSNPEPARKVVEHLVRHGFRGPVRLLMLARQAGTWWDRWRTRLGDMAVVVATEPDPLDTPVVEPGGPDEFEVAHAFATHLEGVVASRPFPGFVGGTPLAIGIGALGALLADPDQPDIPPEDVLVRRAFADWDRTARTLSADARRFWRDCLEVATIAAPADRVDALAMLALVPGLDGEASLSTRQEVADHLRELFPPRDPGLFWGQPLPAVLRDHHLSSATTAPAWLPVLGQLGPGRIEVALAVLAEVAIRREPMADALGALILGDVDGLGPAAIVAASRWDSASALVDGLAAAAGDGTLTSETCERLLAAIPVPAGALARLAVTLRQCVVRDVQDQATRVPGARLRLVEQLTALAEETAASGDREGGLLVAQRAVDVGTELTGEYPVDVAVPLVLAALRLRARLLRDAGRLREAIEAARAEATQCREAVRADPAYLPRLADTSAFLGELYLADGDARKAREAIEEALADHRRTDRVPPAVVARTLCLLSDAQVAAQAPGAAAACLGEAVLILQDLAEANPFGYLHRYAAASGVLAERLRAAGDAQAAVVVATRAVEAYRRLEAQHAEGHVTELTEALCRRSDLLASTGRADEASAAAQQALARVRGESGPVPLHELTAALHTALSRRQEGGDRNGAADMAVQLVAAHRRAVEQGRSELRPALAQALVNLSALLGASGELAQSRLAADEAVALLSDEALDGQAGARAAALNNRAIVLGEAGAYGDPDSTVRAVKDAEAAAAILATTADAEHLARALATLAARRAAAGDLEGSVDAAERLVEVRGEGDRSAYAAALYLLAERYLAAERWERAAQAIDRCRSVYEEIRRRYPESLRVEAAESSMLFVRLPLGYRPQETAITAVRQAVALYRELAADDVPDTLDSLAEAQESLARMLEADGRRAAAADASQQALGTRVSLASDGTPGSLALLAAAQHAHARRLSDIDDPSAIRVARDALATSDRIRDPVLRNPVHAAAAHLLSTLLARTDLEEALTCATTAVTLYRRLADDDPDRYLVDLAHALDNRGRRHRDVGNRKRGAADAETSVELHRRVAGKRPEHRPVLIDALVELAAVTPIEETDARRRIYEEVVATYESLEADHTGRYSTHLLNALTMLIGTLSRSGRGYRADRDRRRRQAQALQARLDALDGHAGLDAP